MLVVFGVVAIGTPLGRVAERVKQTEVVWLKSPHGTRIDISVGRLHELFPAGIDLFGAGVGDVGDQRDVLKLVAAVNPGERPRAARVLPFGISRQSVSSLGNRLVIDSHAFGVFAAIV